MTKAKSTSRRRVRRPSRQDATDPWGPAEDWTGLSVGSTVEVRLAAGNSYLGRVDTKTPDSVFVWVVGFGSHGRQLYGNRDGVRLQPAGQNG